MSLMTRLYTVFAGREVGADQFGNRYYERRGGHKSTRRKRWVVYNGLAEPSKVPPEWHGWLHYTHPLPPTRRSVSHHVWEKPPLPNLTGTPHAYVPPGHLLRGGQRDPATSDYEAWKP